MQSNLFILQSEPACVIWFVTSHATAPKWENRFDVARLGPPLLWCFITTAVENGGERTVVCEAHLAETLEQVLLDLIRRHELGAEGTVETWGGPHKDQSVSIQTRYRPMVTIGAGVADLRRDLAPAWAGEL